MSQTDRGPGSIPARVPDVPISFAASRQIGDEPPAVEAVPGGRRGSSVGLAWRALRRHWWQAILLWAAGSAGLMAMALDRVRPTFDASSTIRVDPGGRASDFEAFKQTMARRVTSPAVVGLALSARPELLGLPRLVRSDDPEAEVRGAVSARVVSGTNLIEIAMAGQSADEAAEIVNAVADAFLKVAPEPVEDERERRIARLREVLEERSASVRQRREAVAGLVDRLGSGDPDRARERDSSAVETYRQLSRQLLRDELELAEEQARLEQIRAEPKGPSPAGPAAAPVDPVAAFYATPEVAEVQSRLTRARERLAQAGRIARNPGDPAWVDARKRVDDLQGQLDALWARRKPPATPVDPAPAVREAERQAAEVRALGLKARLAQLGGQLETLKARTRAEGRDELTLEFARQDLGRAESVLDSVTRALDRAEFEAREPAPRFRLEARARASGRPSVDHRARLMAAIPSAMFLAVLGFLALVEARAGRVIDPEDVPGRLRLGVLGVLPPLPRSRAGSGHRSRREELRSRQELGRFLRSLDHLRVAICAGQGVRGRPRRSVLITSACGGEGKTTMAAQLAERSVNAGMRTLLIDADLRNPSLSRMFELSEARGLVDVLRGEASAEEAIAVIGGAGGFHFLPAGSSRVDPGRLLQNDRLAGLLLRARESFDLVIVDAPPVLPVPDALTLGRWVDGAVLAVRFDSSRYPLVEQARRRLASVGVPVLGAVINGVRGGGGPAYGSDDSPYGPMAEDDERFPVGA